MNSKYKRLCRTPEDWTREEWIEYYAKETLEQIGEAGSYYLNIFNQIDKVAAALTLINFETLRPHLSIYVRHLPKEQHLLFAKDAIKLLVYDYQLKLEDDSELEKIFQFLAGPAMDVPIEEKINILLKRWSYNPNKEVCIHAIHIGYNEFVSQVDEYQVTRFKSSDHKGAKGRRYQISRELSNERRYRNEELNIIEELLQPFPKALRYLNKYRESHEIKKVTP